MVHPAEPAGGRRIGTDTGGKGARLFKDAQDADDQAMPEAVQEGGPARPAQPGCVCPKLPTSPLTASWHARRDRGIL